MTDFIALMNTSQYDFLRTDPRLGDRIMLLGLGGSHAYGTSREGSDVDFRGVALNRPSDILGLTRFEQYESRETDTVIYSFNKIVGLLLECNPNTCELLGLDPDQYLIVSPLGRELLENRHLFLSKRAARSFGGYAGAQLRRIQNALARDSMDQNEREQHILELYIDKAETPGMDTEIFVDASYSHLPLRHYETMWRTMHNVVRDYDHIGKRNRKKDDNHLNKHAMHLIRLFMMAIEILEKGEIRTHRTGDLELLMKIRNGGFWREDRTFDREFYDILADYESRLEKAARDSVLPDNPDMEQVGAFVEAVNRRAVGHV